jgi:hypothetical protein
MALSQRTDWHRAYQNALGVTVYSEYDDGSVGCFGIRFADGTTQFTAASAGGGGTDTLQSASINTTLTVAASTNYLVKATAGAGGISITLPTSVGLAGQKVCIKKVDSGVGTVTVGTTSAQTIDSSTTYPLTNQWQYVTVESDGSNWLIVGNN